MTIFAAPPVRTEFPQTGSPNLFSRPWLQWFQAISTALTSTPPVITGSRGGNVALASLLTQLSSAGVVVDRTTP
jgi:hypothetical protein